VTTIVVLVNSHPNDLCLTAFFFLNFTFIYVWASYHVCLSLKGIKYIPCSMCLLIILGTIIFSTAAVAFTVSRTFTILFQNPEYRLNCPLLGISWRSESIILAHQALDISTTDFPWTGKIKGAQQLINHFNIKESKEISLAPTQLNIKGYPLFFLSQTSEPLCMPTTDGAT